MRNMTQRAFGGDLSPAARVNFLMMLREYQLGTDLTWCGELFQLCSMVDDELRGSRLPARPFRSRRHKRQSACWADACCMWLCI